MQSSFRGYKMLSFPNLQLLIFSPLYPFSHTSDLTTPHRNSASARHGVSAAGFSPKLSGCVMSYPFLHHSNQIAPSLGTAQKDVFSGIFKKLTLFRQNTLFETENLCSIPVGFAFPPNHLGEESP